MKLRKWTKEKGNEEMKSKNKRKSIKRNEKTEFTDEFVWLKVWEAPMIKRSMDKTPMDKKPQ